MLKRSTLFLVLILIAGLAEVSAAASGPRSQLQSTIDQVLAALRDDGMSPEVRANTILELIGERFDYRAMSQRTLAVNWRKASPEQRERFVELFSELLGQSYLGRIATYTDEHVEYGKEQIKKDRAKVGTRIITSSVEIPIDYKLINRDGKWLIYDVAIEEISLVRSYSSTYRDIVKRDGIDGLLARMEDKLEKNRDPALATASKTTGKGIAAGPQASAK